MPFSLPLLGGQPGGRSGSETLLVASFTPSCPPSLVLVELLCPLQAAMNSENRITRVNSRIRKV